jgi:hypothetical protein
VEQDLPGSSHPQNLGQVAMTLHLGYFEKFKGADIVLLTCDPVEVTPFRGVLADVMAKGAPFAIHDLAVVSARNPVRLVLCPAAAPFRRVGGGFIWRLNHVEFATADSRLEVLGRVRAAHEYFDLDGSDVRLMVSVNEYDEVWWARWESGGDF